MPFARAATTLPALLVDRARERGGAVALREKRRGRWSEVTWAAYAERAAQVGLALSELGVDPGDRVAIHAGNRPEWVITDLAVQGIGAISVAVYPTSPPAETELILSHAEARVLVVEGEERLDQALAARGRLPRLERIVVIDPRETADPDDPMVGTFRALERAVPAGGAVDDWAARAHELDGNGTAAIVYTAGTTGPPKGAMITHANLAWAAETLGTTYGARPDDEVFSQLPLALLEERLVSVAVAVRSGWVVSFGECGGALAQDLHDVQPTILLGLPRVWESLRVEVGRRMADATGARRAAYGYGVAGGGRAREALVRRPLRKRLGLSRVRVAVSSTAPAAPQALGCLRDLGIRVRETYALTEATGVCTLTSNHDVRPRTAGRALPGVEVRIALDGEVLVRSPGVFAGYFRDEAATRGAIDSEGWLHTGDVGSVAADGFLKISGRDTDRIITAWGIEISPSQIEQELEVSPYVREVMVVGDRRPHLVALLGIEAGTVGDWADDRGISQTTPAQLSRAPEVLELVGRWVEEVNARLAPGCTVRRFALFPKALSHEDGELTATLKVRRHVVGARFAREIEALYE